MLVEETVRGWLDLAHINAPSFAQVVQNCGFLVHNVHCAIASAVVQADDTVGDALCLDELDPADLSGIISVGSTARFSINTSDVHNAELVARNDTALVKTEAVVTLSISLVHHALVDVDALADEAISLVLNGALLLPRQRLIVRNVQVSLLSGLLGTSLPDVGSQHLAATSEHNVGASVVSQELDTTFQVNFTLNSLSNQINIVRHFSIDLVQHTLANLDCVNDIDFAEAFNCQHASVVLLATRSGVES